MRLAIVGVGNLGGALAELLLAAGFCRDDMTLVTRGSDRSVARCEQLGLEPFGFESLRGVDLVVLTVKPQDIVSVANQLKPGLDANTVVLSMMAGVTCNLLGRLLEHRYIARAMPNLATVVGQSATVYYVSSECSALQSSCVERVVTACGAIYKVVNEELLDVATAVAGSGPAYLCWLGEQMERVALAEGFSSDQAHALVLQTFKGAVAYLEHAGERFSELRSRVTSPNGTTAAALGVLEVANSAEHFGAAISAALERSRVLGRG
jgi:pyrroline-5-carboxylate reductase